MSEDQQGNLRADFLEDGTGNRSSGRLIKVMSWAIAALFALILGIPAAIAYLVAIINPGYAVPDIPANILGMFQIIFYGFLGLAIGAETVQKVTNH